MSKVKREKFLKKLIEEGSEDKGKTLKNKQNF
jgi:hypothetical protein